MSEKISLANLNGGGIVEAVDIALLKIADNIADINTPPAKPRKLTLEIVFTPDKDRSFATAKATVKTSLQPEEAQEIPLLLDKENGANVMYESYRGMNSSQNILPGTLPSDLREGAKVNNVTPFKASKSA
jgi:hypothetical protein